MKKLVIILLVINLILGAVNIFTYFKYSSKILKEITEINQVLQDLDFVESYE